MNDLAKLLGKIVTDLSTKGEECDTIDRFRQRLSKNKVDWISQ
jgi:hypothetical protein